MSVNEVYEKIMTTDMKNLTEEEKVKLLDELYVEIDKEEEEEVYKPSLKNAENSS